MASEEEDDSLPPLGEDCDRYLEDAKKGKQRRFLMVCKGTKIKYLAVRKKPIKKTELLEARKLGYKGEGYFGIITGRGMDLQFNLAVSDGYEAAPVKDKILKDFLDEHVSLKCRPSIVIVATPPEVAFDDEDLQHPLIVRFLNLGERIGLVLDARPEAEAELKSWVSEIRQLLQEAEFDRAEPKVLALEEKLRELLQGGIGTSESISAPTTQPAPTLDHSLADRLKEAFEKLVPKIKQAVIDAPNQKVELLTSAGEIKRQLDAGELQEAQEGLITLGETLRSLLLQEQDSSGADREQADDGSDSRVAYERRLADLQPRYEQALQSGMGDISKIRAIMGFALEKGSANDFKSALKAFDRLQPLLDQSQELTAHSEIEKGLVAKRKFLLTRFKEILAELMPLMEDIRDGILEDDADEAPDEIMAGIGQGLEQLLEELRNEIDKSIDSGKSTDLVGLKQRISGNEIVQLLLENPYVTGSLFEERIYEALEEIEEELTA